MYYGIVQVVNYISANRNFFFVQKLDTPFKFLSDASRLSLFSFTFWFALLRGPVLGRDLRTLGRFDLKFVCMLSVIKYLHLLVGVGSLYAKPPLRCRFVCRRASV